MYKHRPFVGPDRITALLRAVIHYPHLSGAPRRAPPVKGVTTALLHTGGVHRTVENTLVLCHCATPTPSRLFTERFYSQALDQERDVCIYLPEHFDPEQTYPIVYATDGQVIVSGRYKAILDSLIGNRIIPPLVLVGAYSDETTTDDGMEFRYYEYIAGADEPDGETAGNSKPGGEAAGNSKPGGETAGADEPDGKTAGNSKPGGKTAGDNKPGGETAGNSKPDGDAAGADEPDGETASDNKPGGEAAGNSKPGGKTAGNSKPGGKTAGNNKPGGETAGDNKPGGETAGNSKPGGEAAGNSKPGGKTAGNDGTDPRIAGRFGRHLRFFTRELRDTLLRRHAICRDTGKTLFFGCSNGGDYGLTLWGTLPAGSFTRYICLSPVGTDADEVVPCRSGSTLYVAYGEQEAAMPVIGDNLRALHERLDAIGNGSVTVRIFAGGHDRTCWEREFATALTVLMNR